MLERRFSGDEKIDPKTWSRHAGRSRPGRLRLARNSNTHHHDRGPGGRQRGDGCERGEWRRGLGRGGGRGDRESRSLGERGGFRVLESAAETVIEGEELRVQARERLAEFGQLFLRSVNFQPAERDELEGLVEQVSDIREMGERAFRVGISFAAVRGLASKRETVVETLLLVLRLGDELFAKAAKSRLFIRRDVEVRNNGAALIFGRRFWLARP